jgi:hypothetical protein
MRLSRDQALQASLLSGRRKEVRGQAAAADTQGGGGAPDIAALGPDCVATTGYTTVRFRTDGELGACPLYLAARFDAGAQRDTTGPPCALDDCFAATRVAVAAGITEIPVPMAVAGQPVPALAGMQWELDLPSDGARTLRRRLHHRRDRARFTPVKAAAASSPSCASPAT